MRQDTTTPARRTLVWAMACVWVALLAACGGGTAPVESGPSLDGAPPALGIDSRVDGGSEPLAQTDQLIVRFDRTVTEQQFVERAAEFERNLSLQGGTNLRALRQTAGGNVVVALPQSVGWGVAQQLAQRLVQMPGVAHVEPDRVLQVESTPEPNDPRWGQQWWAGARQQRPGQIDLRDAWTVTTGHPEIVVAVLDTGVLPHVDLSGRLLPGYDFVSDVRRGNDGDGRDADASDPGDWIDGTEPWARELAPRTSTWHGTYIAGIVTAVRNNAQGVAGVAPDVRVLPVRVLGRGGGHVSDIADGLRWAVGEPVPGAPTNPHPARIVNLSFGARGTCSQEMQSALEAAHRRGALVIASAGNLNADVSQSTIASCPHVLPVAAVGRLGERASYSNTGVGVWMAAPGGNYPADTGVVSLADGGPTTPLSDNAYRHKQGTSSAAPMVAAVAALAWSANPGLTAAQLRAVMESAAQPFPVGTADDCAANRCGVGIVNAASAVSMAALSPVVASTNQARSAGLWPVAGAWHDPAQAAWRVWLDPRGGELLAVFQGPLASEAASWALTRLQWDATAEVWSGELLSFRDGTRLSGAALSPLPQAALGQVRLDLQDTTRVTVRWAGRTFQLRPEVEPASGPSAESAVRSGLWWSPERPGQVLAVDGQRVRPRLTWMAYAADGLPVVWDAELAPRSQGVWAARTLPGPGSGGSEAISVFEWRQQSSDRAEIRLVDGRVWSMRAGPTPTGDNDPQAMTAGLLGIWDARLGVPSLNERWTLSELRPSDVQVGDYNVLGFNGAGGVMLGGWSSRFDNYSLYAPGLLLDDFYVFRSSGSAGWQGCYHYFQLATQRLSDCVPFAAARVGSAEQAIGRVWPSNGFGVGDRSKESALLAGLPGANASVSLAYMPEHAELPAEAGKSSAPPLTASRLMTQALALRAQWQRR